MKNIFLLKANNIYTMTIWRLFVVLALFSISRFLFYIFNQSYFTGMSASHLFTLMGSGIKFDLTAVLYTNIIFIVMMVVPFRFRYNRIYQLVAKWLFIITNSLALLVNVVDIVYFRYTMRRTDFGFVTEFQGDDNKSKIFGTALLQNWYLTLLFILMVFLLFKLYGKVKESRVISSRWTYYSVSTIIMGLSFWLTICGMRGGFGMSTRPITIGNAGANVNQPIETAIVLNTPFSIYRTLSRSTFKRINYFPENKIETIYSPIHQGNDSASFQKMNVVILILESFSKEHSGYFNKQFNGVPYKGYTPFLDSLAQQGKTWVYSYANGSKSIDAIPSVLGSVPSLVQPFVLSRYSLNKMNGLPALLHKEGYSTAFFHGAPNGSMGFDAITNMLGFDKYVGKNEYHNDADFDGYWGIRDEPFLQFFAHSMDKMPKPFMASVFTLSSHHPYKLDPKYESVFKGGTMPVHRVVQYSDYALKEFFQTVSKTSWFKNTLFVITADHSLPSSEHAEYKSPMGVFSIPIIFYQSGSDLHSIDSTTVMQQIDIMPTVLGYLKYDKPYFAYGRNHFNASEQPFISNYTNGVYQYVEGEYAIHSDGEKLLAVYDYRQDKLLTTNLINKSIPDAQVVFEHFKAYLQQYNNRMIDNKMVVQPK
ncbi:MAG: sulfatase-like hydrolase/transferase [Bacteroidales bacterium]|nr:sulfatase-like hydrolase/transferase [Bacteroidales bacterium]